jgi:hypothetical protein
MIRATIPAGTAALLTGAFTVSAPAAQEAVTCVRGSEATSVSAGSVVNWINFEDASLSDPVSSDGKARQALIGVPRSWPRVPE